MRRDVVLGQSQLIVEMTVEEQTRSSDRAEIGYLRKCFCDDSNLTGVSRRTHRVRVGEKMMLPFDDLRAIHQGKRYQFSYDALRQILIPHPLNLIIEKPPHFANRLTLD